VTRLAPALLEHECTAQLCIVGASRENIKTEQFPPNVDLLGTSSDEEVEKLFRRCGLFIAPIANAFGSKIKLLDCLVFGTPFACTANALSGLSGLEGIPTFALDDPHGAARLVSDLLADETARLRLSERVSAYRNEALLRQAEGWHRAIYRTSDGLGPSLS
jgi:glycosyltransferase involved in cell wall biosynthesis